MQSQVLSTITTASPISLTDVKAHLVVEHDEDNDLIQSYIDAALDYAETRTELSLRLRRFKLFGQCWPNQVVLTHGPIRSIETVQYRDADDVNQAIAVDDWGMYEHRGNAVLDFHITPPSVGSTRRDAVSIQYIAGFGALASNTPDQNGFPYTLPLILGYASSLDTDAGDTLPGALRQGVLMMVGHWYENRETTVVGTTSGKLAHAADDLFGSMRIMGV